MKQPKLDLADLVVTSFETAPASAYPDATGGPTPDTHCFDCPILLSRSCDRPCF